MADFLWRMDPFRTLGRVVAVAPGRRADHQRELVRWRPQTGRRSSRPGQLVQAGGSKPPPDLPLLFTGTLRGLGCLALPLGAASMAH